jgi:DNA-binding NtrC family response regulator
MSATRPKVLCVDDEPNVLEGLKLHLSPMWEVVTTTSGALALELLARQGAFAVVISDMRMPGMDGATLLGIIRQRSPHTVRILLTGQVEADAATAAVDAGFFRVLKKPCAPGVLVSVVKDAVRQYNQTVGK